MVEHHPVHNSEVFLLGLAPRPSVPPPSPPSPLTPTDAGSATPIEPLCLDSSAGDNVDEEANSAARCRRVAGAIHVLNIEATSLRNLTQLYKTDAAAADSFNAAVDAIARQCADRGGKLIITGVGKSGHIGKKLVATFNSLGLPSTFLHPTEALHGDLGKVGSRDALLFITFSGRTAELLALLPHVDPALPVVVLTAATQGDCELVRRRPGAILLPAPIHEPETVSFGVSAPTTSTTVALALGDALAVVVSQELHTRPGGSVASVFARNHPGGAIGAAFNNSNNNNQNYPNSPGKAPISMRDLAAPIADIPLLSDSTAFLSGADVLKAGYGSPSGWVRVGDALACPRRIGRLDATLLARPLTDAPEGLFVPRGEWICIAADTRPAQAARWIRDPLFLAPEYCEGKEEASCADDSVVAIVDPAGDVIGVLEAGDLLRWREG
ncbi:putative sis domain-containing protein [Rosellinia necatrix]|uniref:Putative sis domain-containing protein n=1 Tax=Rosellinia necatrix TaxID=77044 RepID=A0A1W2TCT0_ROSNE|nr:putative sis domain-containing protein [Rosellinia necatrix]